MYNAQLRNVCTGTRGPEGIMEYIFGAVQAVVVIAVVWVRLSELGKRVDSLEKRFNSFMDRGRLSK